MAPKEHSNKNPSVNEIRSGVKQKKNPPRRPGSGSTSQKGNCKFCGSSYLGVLVLLSVKRVVIVSHVPEENARSWRENSTCHG